MSVDTEIKGSPGDIEAAADWVKGQLAPKIDKAADAFNQARKDAESSWRSVAGDGFVDVMEHAYKSSDRLHGAATTMAADLDEFASSLRTCQSEMATVRKDARAAGLVVNGFLVEDPGPGPSRPPATFTGTEAEVDDYDRKVAAYNAHQELLAAYSTASTEAARVDRKYDTACTKLQGKYTLGAHAAWIVTLTDLLRETAAGGIGVSIALRRSKLHQQAEDLLSEVRRAIADINAHPERYLKRKWFFWKTLDEAHLRADQLALEGKLGQASQLLDDAAKLESSSKVLKYLGRGGKILGPLGLGLGMYNDYQEGESTTQVVVSQGVSFGAGVATGAAVGAAVGSVVPVAGTAVGAVVGAGAGAVVGIFSDGAIDSVFENGPDVGKAVDAGVDALKDTGGAIADGVSGAAHAIGGLLG